LNMAQIERRLERLEAAAGLDAERSGTPFKVIICAGSTPTDAERAEAALHQPRALFVVFREPGTEANGAHASHLTPRPRVDAVDLEHMAHDLTAGLPEPIIIRTSDNDPEPSESGHPDSEITPNPPTAVIAPLRSREKRQTLITEILKRAKI
jgi:hypothetical protein